MKTNDIRKVFLEYFKKRGHTIVPSSSLIPHGDPTLLFTNAGMVQFKDLFLGVVKRGAYKRAASIQKCMRAGGKHSDLENVGRTSRHHTFFEMLGNFSFGDYFKEEAIPLAWEFLTDVMRIDMEKLWITVFKEDDEAAKIWEEGIGIKPERIVRLGEEDNFWAMGDTGPCGPCSEILVDQGEDVGCKRPECRVGCSCDRFLELWNLVFMQYNRDVSGRLTPLPRPSIDTGMGLERLAAIVQGVKSDYDIDIFRDIINRIEEISCKAFHKNTLNDFSMQVIADHSRAITFLLTERILPSNEGRGYVLRRIIRRAARHGRRLGVDNPFLLKVCERVIEIMSDTYPETLKARDFMEKVISGEEERFSETLDKGLILLDDLLKNLREEGRKEIPGPYIFKLYDTYGFPIDIARDIAIEQGFEVDMNGFEKEMTRQREKARNAWKAGTRIEESDLYREMSKRGIRTEFIGYSKDSCRSKIISLLQGDRCIDKTGKGGKIGIITDKTPFYAESGGQVGDRGLIIGKGLKVTIIDTKRPVTNIIIHYGIVNEGIVKVGDNVKLIPDNELRRSTRLNHTATHLLQAVLRETIGSHVQQAGSLVAPDRLRFDFSHFSGLTSEEILRIESEVNRLIREDIKVSIEYLPFDKAIKRGAIALFDEKYGDIVRLVAINSVSKELCGGLHVRRTGEIGLFRIIGESAVAAGIRRIEALTGVEAYRMMKDDEAIVRDAANMLKSNRSEVKKRIEKLLQKQKEMEKEIISLKDRLKGLELKTLLQDVRQVDGIKVLSTMVEIQNPGELRDWADRIRAKMGSGVVALGAKGMGKAFLLVAVTKDLTRRFHAGEIVKVLAKGIDGKGGGRPEMGQAGGKNSSRLKEVLEGVYKLVSQAKTN